MLRSPVPLVALGVAALVASAAAHHSYGECDSGGNVALGTIEIGPGLAGGDGTGTFYIDDRAFIGGNGLWIYQETNTVYGTDIDLDGDVDAHDNLQRGAGYGYCDACSDTCVDVGPWDGDLRLF